MPDIFWFIFSMVLKRGSSLRARVGGQDRPGLIEDQICEMIATEVVTVVRGSISGSFGSIKVVMIELLDDQCATLFEAVVVAATTVVVVAGIRGERFF